MKKILKIEADPPVNYNPGVAQPLSILYSGKIKNPDIYLMDRYVQLYYDNYLGEMDKPILSFYIPGENYFNLLTMETVEDDDIICDDIVMRICKEIKNKYYVQMMLQEYYIPGALFYRTNKRIHQHLIYGFDDKKKIFYILCHKKNCKYGTLEVSFEDFLIAYKHREGSPYAYIKLKPNKGIKLKREKDVYLYDTLYDYINSKNPFSVGTFEKNVYGLNIYDKLIDYLHSECLDMRDYQALLQHKQIMFKRIKDYLKQSELAFRYKTVLDLAVRVHFSALKWNITKEDRILAIIENNLIEMKKQEKEILLDVYNVMKPSKKKNTKDISNKTNRPYNLETKVRDTLHDTEVWDILEEYIPNIRNNSQLPLVYGMRLKNIIGKGHYFGVTVEQEKEFLERIFALQPRA